MVAAAADVQIATATTNGAATAAAAVKAAAASKATATSVTTATTTTTTTAATTSSTLANANANNSSSSSSNSVEFAAFGAASASGSQAANSNLNNNISKNIGGPEYSSNNNNMSDTIISIEAAATGTAAAAGAGAGEVGVEGTGGVGVVAVPSKSAVSQRNVDIKIEQTGNMEAATQQLTKKVLKLDLGGKNLDEYSLKSPKSPIAARLPHQTSLTSSVDVEDRKTLREALYQGIFHRHRRTIFAVGSFLRMLRSRNSQYNTIRSSSEGEDIDETSNGPETTHRNDHRQLKQPKQHRQSGYTT